MSKRKSVITGKAFQRIIKHYVVAPYTKTFCGFSAFGKTGSGLKSDITCLRCLKKLKPPKKQNPPKKKGTR